MSFAHLLKRAGYATCITGKWQLGREVELPRKFGFDEYCLWQHTRRPPRYANPGLEINGSRRTSRGVNTAPTSSTTTRWISSRAIRMSPFFRLSQNVYQFPGFLAQTQEHRLRLHANDAAPAARRVVGEKLLRTARSPTR